MPPNRKVQKQRVLLIDGKSGGPLAVGLERQGYDVTACDSPQKAWGFVYPIRPHFIILHVEEPSNRDVFALQECRALAGEVPVFVATDASRIDACIRELGRGSVRYLSLPLKDKALGALCSLESYAGGE
jgi:DNA-binding NtrC family response regulator